MDKQIVQDLDRVLAYLWKDEFADYLETSPLEDRQGHIFTSLKRLKRWLSAFDRREHVDDEVQALRAIHRLIDGRHWDAGTLDVVADILRGVGLAVRSPSEVVE